MDGKITIREKGKRYIVGLFKIADLECRVSDPDTHQLDSSFKTLIALNDAVHLIDRGSLPLTERSVHTEYLNNDDLSPYFWNGESLFAADP